MGNHSEQKSDMIYIIFKKIILVFEARNRLEMSKGVCAGECEEIMAMIQ